MSWFKPAAAAVACFLLAGCGFQPLYGTGARSDELASQLASIRVSQITEHYGQVMTNELNDGLNPHARHVPIAYQLDVVLREALYDLAARGDGTPSRTALNMTATWALRRLKDNQIVAKGVMKSSAGHDVLDNDYANVVSSNSGEMRAVRDLSDQIQMNILAYLQTPPKT